jgi:hypothetical protein
MCVSTRPTRKKIEVGEFTTSFVRSWHSDNHSDSSVHTTLQKSRAALCVSARSGARCGGRCRHAKATGLRPGPSVWTDPCCWWRSLTQQDRQHHPPSASSFCTTEPHQVSDRVHGQSARVRGMVCVCVLKSCDAWSSRERTGKGM